MPLSFSVRRVRRVGVFRPKRARIAPPLRGGAAPTPSSQMVITQLSRRAREAVHAALGDHRPLADPPPLPRQPASSRPWNFTFIHRGRTQSARRALPSTLSQAQMLGTASQSTTRVRIAHSQHMHDAHTSPSPLAPTAKMQFGAACRRMCSSTRTQLSFTMHLQHVRVLTSQLVAGHANRGGLESVFKNSACKPPDKRHTASSLPDELTLRSVERSYA